MTWDFQEWLIIALFASLFFKEEFKMLVLHYFGVKGTEDKLQEGMNYMKLHFNDELTHILTELQVDQKNGFDKMEEKQDAAKKCIEKANTKLDEFDRYGIKTRV